VCYLEDAIYLYTPNTFPPCSTVILQRICSQDLESPRPIMLPSILLTTSSKFSGVLKCRLASLDRFWSGSGLSLQTDPRLSHSMASHPTTPLSCMVSHSVLSEWVLCFSSCTTADVALIAVQHGVDLHSYRLMIGLQAYTGCSSTDASKSAVQLLHCVEEVDKWMYPIG